MPFSISWYIQDRVILSHVTGLVTISELKDYNTTLMAHIQAGQYPVHSIIYQDGVTRIPRDVLAIRRTLTVLDLPDLGWAVHVNENRSPWMYVGLLLAKMTNSRAHGARTVDEAMEFLRTQDATLETYAELRWFKE